MKTYNEFMLLTEYHHSPDTLYYHGSNKIFDSFIPSEASVSYGVPTYHFTKDIRYARNYGDIIYVVKLDIGDRQVMDTTKPEHKKIFLETLYKYYNIQKDKNQIESISNDFENELPFWTNDFAIYSAWKNQFQGIFLSEEKDSFQPMVSIAIFNKHKIKIVKVEKI
jgi:hypothetical protein